MKYCFDTSAFINPRQKYYPIRSFPGLWDRLDQLIVDGNIITPEDVLFDLKKKEDDLYHWVAARTQMIREIDEDLQIALSEVMANYGLLLVDVRRDRSASDPVVVALAKITGRAVVSDERPSRKPHKSLRIPDVCRAMGIQHLTPVELVLEQDWTFR